MGPRVRLAEGSQCGHPKGLGVKRIQLSFCATPNTLLRVSVCARAPSLSLFLACNDGPGLGRRVQSRIPDHPRIFRVATLTGLKWLSVLDVAPGFCVVELSSSARTCEVGRGHWRGTGYLKIQKIEIPTKPRSAAPQERSVHLRVEKVPTKTTHREW